MSKKAADTNEVEILDEAFMHHGGLLGWSAFGEQVDPAELVARLEEGGEEPDRAAVLRRVLDLVLSGWAREVDVARVGVRALGLAAGLSHWAGAGVPLEGARTVREGEGADEARRVLDFLFMDWKPGGDPVAVGKTCLAVGRFLNHAELEGWSLHLLGKACDETPAGVMERVKRLCNKPIQRQGGRGKATWQQGEEQKAKSAKAQTGKKRGKNQSR